MPNWIAALLTLSISLAWLRIMDFAAHRGWIESRLSRKIIHIATGPVFVLCWFFFRETPDARWWAALVPPRFDNDLSAMYSTAQKALQILNHTFRSRSQLGPYVPAYTAPVPVRIPKASKKVSQQFRRYSRHSQYCRFIPTI